MRQAGHKPGPIGGETVSVNKLRGIMAERGYSAATLAKAIGMNVDTLRRKIRSGSFYTHEAWAISEVLEIEDPASIFFGPDVTREVTK